MTDTKEITIKETISIDHEKLKDFVEGFRADFEAGNITLEEIEEAVSENLKEFADIKIE